MASRYSKITVLLLAAAAAGTAAGISALISPVSLRMDWAEITSLRGQLEGPNLNYDDLVRAGEATTGQIIKRSIELEREGASETSVALLEAHLTKNPNDLPVRKRLARLLYTAGRYDEYAQTLERILQQTNSLKIAVALSQYYKAEYQRDDWARMASWLADQNEISRTDLLDLARYQANRRHFKKSVLRYRQAAENFSDPWNSLDIEQFTLSAFNAGVPSILDEPLPTLLERFDRPEPIASQIQSLVDQAAPEAALKITSALSDEVRADVQVALATARAHLMADETDHAVEIIESIYRSQIPTALLPRAIQLALDTDNQTLIFDTLNADDLLAMHTDVLIQLVPAALKSERGEFLKQATKQKPELYGLLPPLVGHRLALAVEDRPQAAALDKQIAHDLTTPVDHRIAAIDRLTSRGEKETAIKALERLERTTSASVGMQLTIGERYLALGWPGHAARVAKRVVKNSKTGRAQILLGRALMAVDRPQEAIVHLRPNLPGDLATELAYVKALADLNDDDLPTYLAARFAEPKIGLERADAIANIILTSKNKNPRQFNLLRPHIEKLIAKSRSADSPQNILALQEWINEAGALQASADTMPDEPTGALADGSLGAPNSRDEIIRALRVNVTGETQVSLTQKLIDLGHEQDAIPYVERLAREHGGDWANIYAALLRKYTMNDRLAAFLGDRGLAGYLPIDERRAAAIELLALGQQAPAIKILRRIAEAQGPDSQDLYRLLSLWGRPAPNAAIDWLAQRALSAANQQRSRWLQHLQFAGGDIEVANIAEAWSRESSLDQDEDVILIRSLISLRDEERITQRVALGGLQKVSTDVISGLAQDCRAQNLLDGAAILFDIALSRPAFQNAAESQDVRVQAAWVQFHRGSNQNAIHLYSQFLANGGEGYEHRYWFGRSLRAAEQTTAAGRQFKIAHDLAERDTGNNFLARKVQAFSLAYLGNIDTATNRFTALLAERPRDKKLAQEIRQTLEEIGQLETFEQIDIQTRG